MHLAIFFLQQQKEKCTQVINSSAVSCCIYKSVVAKLHRN